MAHNLLSLFLMGHFQKDVTKILIKIFTNVHQNARYVWASSLTGHDGEQEAEGIKPQDKPLTRFKRNNPTASGRGIKNHNKLSFRVKREI